MHKETRLTEEDAKKAETERKRKADEKPEIDFGKKKKMLDNKKHLLGGFGGLKVKGKALKVVPTGKIYVCSGVSDVA